VLLYLRASEGVRCRPSSSGAILVYARRLWAARGTLVMAIVLMVMTAMPVLVFDYMHRDRSSQYFSRTTTLNPAQSVEENARRVVDQYQRFFSRAFLFENGDPLTRHAVPGFGELYWTMLPPPRPRVLWCLWPRHPEGKLLPVVARCSIRWRRR
jgi:hypothetical protein